MTVTLHTHSQSTPSIATANTTRFSAALQALRAAQKPGGGVPAYTRWVNRRLARYGAAAAYALGWSANAVTAASAALSAAGVVVLLIAPISAATGIIAAALFAVGYVLDSADGQVARLSGSSSRAGEWLDHVVDALRIPAMHLAVLAALWLRGELGGWAFTVVAAYCVISVGQFMSQILAEQLGGRERARVQGPGIRHSLVIAPTDTGVFCWLFALWGAPALFLGAYTALLLINAAYSAVSMRRKYQRLESAGEGASV